LIDDKIDDTDSQQMDTADNVIDYEYLESLLAEGDMLSSTMESSDNYEEFSDTVLSTIESTSETYESYESTGEAIFDIKKHSRSSAAELKHNALETPLIRALQQFHQPCNETCKFKRDCTYSTTLEELFILRTELWGTEEEKPPKDGMRSERLLHFLQTRSRMDNNNSISFRINDRWVCECAFLRVIGAMIGVNLTNAPKMYHRLKKGFYGGDSKEKLLDETKVKLDTTDVYTEKRGHCRVRYFKIK
jgi:hypothetical protein